MSKRIIRIDASALKESACMLRFYRIIIEGYRSPLVANDVLFGSAFHEYIAEMERTGGDYGAATKVAREIFSKDCIVKSDKKYLTETYLLSLCMRYWDEYLKHNDFVTVFHNGKPLVELKFALPYISNDEVEVILCGTIDRIAKHKHGTYAIPDYKTTSVGKVEQYLHSYWMSPQLMFYRLVLSLYAKLYPDSFIAEINKKGVGCFIDGIFLRGKDKDAEFHRSDVMFFPEQQMKEFEMLLEMKIKHLLNFLSCNITPQREGMINGACETKYGSCGFMDVCRQPDEISMNHLLRRNFIQKDYDPLNF